MILHIYPTEDITYYYYYNGLKEDVNNASAPNGYYATNLGYLSKAHAKKINAKVYRVENTSFGCTKESVDDLCVRIKPDTVILLASTISMKYYTYINAGDTHDGLKKANLNKDFNLTKENVVYRAADITDKDIVKMIKKIYGITGEVFHKDMGEKYWHPKRVANPHFIGNTIISFPHLPDVYVGVKIKEDSEVSKGIGELNYTMVRGDKDELLKRHIDALKAKAKDVPVIVNIIDLHSEATTRDLSIYDSLIRERVFCLDIYSTITGIPIGKIYRPPNLMFIAGEEIDAVYKTIDTMEVHDITDKIYENKATTKEVEKGILKFKIDKLKIVLRMGVDTVTRNVFAKLKKEDIKVELLLKKYPKIVKYYTRITYGDIEIISYAPHSSLIIL